MGKDWSVPTKCSSIKSANLIKIKIFSRDICYEEKLLKQTFYLEVGKVCERSCLTGMLGNALIIKTFKMSLTEGVKRADLE